MKLLFVARNISNRRWGGFEEHIFNLYNRLKRNHEIKILTTSIEEVPRNKFDEDIFILESKKLLGYCLVDELKLLKIVKSFNPNIIHLQGWGSHPINFFVLNSSKFNKLGIKVVITPHEFFHKMNLLKRIYNLLLKRRFLRKVNAIVALTKRQKAELVRLCRNTKYIPNGINVKDFKNIRMKDEGFILMVGRLEKYKGFREVLKVCKDLNKKLVIVGRYGEEYKYLKRNISKWKIDAEIHLNVNRKELLNFYERASLFVEASSREGFGITIIEALASGLPVISKPVGVALDIPRDYVKLYRSETELKRLIENEIGRKSEIFHDARKFVFDNFSWDTIAGKYQKFYDSLLGV